MPFKIASIKSRFRTKKKGGVRMPTPVKTDKKVEVKYRKDILNIIQPMIKQVEQETIAALRTFEKEFTGDAYAALTMLEKESISDAYAAQLEEIFLGLRARYSNLDSNFKAVSSKFVNGLNKSNKDRFYKNIEKSMGVDLKNIIQNEGLDDIVTAKIRENVSLIKSVPEEYFKKIEQAVFQGTTSGSKLGSLINRIKHIGKVETNRARLIARDQTSKLTGIINKQRQTNLGVEEYIWRTSRDEEVRESHDKHNGKVFRWDSPPKDTGHPGEDINCRCVAQPIIKL